MVERAIQTVKFSFVKAHDEGTDPLVPILNYNMTPKQNLVATCDLLMGRKLRNLICIKVLREKD